MLFHILMQVISFLLTRKDLFPCFMFSMHVTLENLQVLGRSSWNRDLLFLLFRQRVGNQNSCWGFVWSRHFHFSFNVKDISIKIVDNYKL